ncbi:MAG TPA: heat-inducible transcriptional repressor HrcA [Candidatus Krumholzibacteria bacterium]|jgi:heat-inducible transcriptional repressor|nr:heat-inducible transcriptional repressor HrcA [Candidatus Krumholzibacteria bacterium]
MQLTERERTVLAALVELFVRDAGPVSSGHLQEIIGLGVSSATIRNVLQRLEEKGLLHQPHTSAGRVPTRDGYRVYVESFCRPARLPATWVRRIHEELLPAGAQPPVQEVLAKVSQLLAALSSNVGFGVAVEDHHSARVQRIEMVQLEHARLLVLVTLDDGMVRTCLAPLERRYPDLTLALAEHLLHDIVRGCTPGEARRRLDVALAQHTGDAGTIARVVAREKEKLFEERAVPTVRLEGATQIIGQPEFQDPENLRLLVKVLDHPERLGQGLPGAGTTITIGVATDVEELPFSIVSAAMQLGGWEGQVGILGPMRMRYALALALVQSVVETLSGVEPRPEGGPRERA